MRTIFFAILFSIPVLSGAQNLVPNPGFEEIDNCPFSFGQIRCPLVTSSIPQSVTAWRSVMPNSPDYFNSCSRNKYATVPDNFWGYHPAHSGNAYTGVVYYSGSSAPVVNYYAEYITAQLLEPLQAGKWYDVSCFVKPVFRRDQSNSSAIVAAQDMGVAFTDTQLTAHTRPFSVGNIKMQQTGGGFIKDTTGWTRVSTLYIAKGGEQWMSIGNFHNYEIPPLSVIFANSPNDVNSHSAYYIIDDVAVMPVKCDTVTNTYDTAICRNMLQEQVFTSSAPVGSSYTWNNGQERQGIKTTEEGIYWCRAQYGCGIYSDTFKLTVINEQDKCRECLWLPSAFSPNGDGLNDLFKAIPYCTINEFSFRIYNRWGQQVFYTTDPRKGWNGMHGSDLADVGTYFYFTEYSIAATGKSELLKGDVLLLR